MAYILLDLVAVFLLRLAAPRSPAALVAAIAALGTSLGLADVFSDEVFIAMVALLAGVEVLFVRAGLFAYHGWNVGYSMAAFGLRFAIAAWWISHFERVGYTRWFRLLLVSVSLTYAWWLEAMVMSSLGRLWAVRLHLLPNPSSDEVVGMFLLVGLPFFAVGLTAVLSGWCSSAGRTGLVGDAWAGYLYSLQGAGLRRHHPAWSPLYQGALAAGIIWGCAQLDRWWQRECPPVQAQRTS